jgi:anti-sigma B factor antagonist
MTILHPQARRRAGLVSVIPTATIIELDGEIDIFTSRALRERMIRALRHSTGLLICDLSRVSFCDASGLAVLVGVQRRARSMGITVGLAAPSLRMAELLRVTGLDRGFAMYGDDSGKRHGEAIDRDDLRAVGH